MDSQGIFELVGWWVAAMSVVTLVLFGVDKGRAKKAGARRIAESTLLGCCLLGGWPGGLLGMLIFRHKSAKPSFLFGFWAAGVLVGYMIFRILRMAGKL